MGGKWVLDVFRMNEILFQFFRALENLINFAYSGTVKIDNQNVQSLMVGASFLQLNKVRDACADFLISRYALSHLMQYWISWNFSIVNMTFQCFRFHAHNVLGIRQFADSLSCTQLVSAAEKYIHHYFSKVAQSEEFLSLSKLSLCSEFYQFKNLFFVFNSSIL